MSRITVCIAIVALFVSAFVGSVSSRDIVNVDQSTFDKTILQSRGLWLVAFIAPWCGHCQRLEPELQRAAKALGGVVNVARVNADQERSLAHQYGIQGFPTLKIFPAGPPGTKRKMSNVDDYMGARSAKAIVDTLMYRFRGIQDPVVKAQDLENLKEFLGQHTDVPRTILFTTKPSNPDLFKSVALEFDNDREMKFAVVTNADIKSEMLEAAGVKGPRALVVVPEGKSDIGDRVAYDGTLKKRDIMAFLKKYAASGNSEDSSKSTGAGSEHTAAERKSKERANSVVKIDSQKKLEELCDKICVVAVVDSSDDGAAMQMFNSIATRYGSNKDAVLRFGTLNRNDLADAAVLDASLAPTYEQEEVDDATKLDVVVIRKRRKRYLRKTVTKDNAHELIDRLLDGFAGLTFKSMEDGTMPTLFASESKPKDEL